MELLDNPTVEIDGTTYEGLPLNVSPAGMTRHHSYRGGYIDHIVSTFNLALALCKSVEEIYNGQANRDFVIAGVLLHDVFKSLTYKIRKDGSYSRTRLADSLDHISLATAELVRREFPLELIHIVSAHHGDYGPIRPHSVEALICHLADLMDSRLNSNILSAARYLSRRAVGQEPQGLTTAEALEVIRAQETEGPKGTEKVVRELLQRKRDQS